MAIVTISRGTFAGGELLADLLGELLGYSIVSRETLYETVQRDYGVTRDDLVQIMTWAPTRLDARGGSRRRLFASIQAALSALVQQDNVVYHGQAGHLLLPDIAHVLRIRLIAPRTRRIEMAMEREACSALQASGKIDQVDSERARWTEFVFGANWTDPSLYDVVLNLDRMSLESAAALVHATAQLPEFQTTPESRRRMDDLTLESAVLARLLGDPSTSDLDLAVAAQDGRVTISGLTDPRRGDQVLGAARRAGESFDIEIAGLDR